ncbi:efflux RND transporter periplasmic adaptor subunit [Hylemonella sp. W303a]|uniref:efflux RND transporter periplasmic adaptor subunit n=1 Tax=Hylemonella sp. W303a TaxID=3389873 RepID=UPI00396B36E5
MKDVSSSALLSQHRGVGLAALGPLALSLLLLSGCGGPSDEAAKPEAAANAQAAAATDLRPALTVTVARPQSTQLAGALLANGNVMAWQEAVIGAEVNGLRLAAVHVNVGDKVSRGDELARFASEIPYAAALQAQANYENAKSEADRVRALGEEGIYSRSQLTQIYTTEKVAKAQWEAAQVTLAATRVLAPDDGVISARSATVGAVVGSGNELFRMVRQSRMEWRAEVTPAEIGRVKIGQQVEVTTVSGLEVQGTVRAIAPTADPQTRNILVYVDLPRNEALKANTFARGNFVLPGSAALTVPAQAVVPRDGHSYVFVVDGQARVSQRKVEVGRRVGERVEVLQGLAAQDAVAVQGAGFLNEGDLVKVVQ